MAGSTRVPWRSLLVLTLGVWAGCASAGAPGGEPLAAPRTTLSLDGTWRIEDSVAGDQIPKSFRHTGPVPGLAHSAAPSFANVDKYQTKQLLSSLVYYGLHSQADYDRLGNVVGTPEQHRNYFWYQRRFTAPARRLVAILRVGKAQFGTVVYLNGVRIGEHDSCFTAGYFDVSRAIRWNQANDLVIRIGAHPGVLPPTVSPGTDFEKYRWTPGIYDSVSLIATNNPVIATIQVAPRLATPSNVASILVQAELHNYADHPVETDLRQQVFEWKSGLAASDAQGLRIRLAAAETRLVEQVIPVPAAHLWSPEDPFLYRVDTSTAGDETRTRFGMREFHFDTVTRRGYLNGQPYFLRGSNIALHRFFEDPQSGTLPWNEAWVKRLLVTLPKQMHWNAFRFTLSPVPDRWLEIADEAGLLIEYEYSVWVGSPIYTSWRSSYDTEEMIGEYREWMRDSWNHPSVFLWDATNESWLPEFATKVIPAVRSLDLSHRAWENSYNAPDAPDDVVEDHNYFLEALGGKFDASGGGKPFELSDLQLMDGIGANPFTKSNHAKIVNEYGWVWLNRDGSPTILTQNLFPKLLGDRNTVENRRALNARIVAGETELFRAYRQYAGVMHFCYLTSSEPGGFTSDNFIDIQTLQLEPHFAEEMEQASRPLGVYLNFWQPTAVVQREDNYTIYLVNDEDRPRTGTLRLVFVDDHAQVVTQTAMQFSVPPLGAQSYTAFLGSPAVPGHYVLRALAEPIDDATKPTISTRDVMLQAQTPD